MKNPVGVLLIALGLIAIFAFMGKALWDIGGLQGLTGGHPGLLVALGVAVVGTGALAAVLMRLAFFSSRKGYDETVRFEDPGEADRQD
jgi:hypothetical protein